MRGREHNRTLDRIAHAALLVLYVLAAVFGLFLHSSHDSTHGVFPHVCAASSPDIESQAPQGTDHDESRCALCHTHDRLSLAHPEAAVVAERPLATADLDLPCTTRLASASVLVPRSRGPPSAQAV